MSDVDTPRYVQRDQPAGVPALELTGERTLPDVPEENYWFRRHLVVYDWIAERLAARKQTGTAVRAVDLACGEGYGSETLARAATHVVGVDANPEAHEHARLRYVAPNLRFDRDLVETWQGDVDTVVFLQTIEHVQDPDALLARFAVLAGPTGEVYVSTPNLLTLAPEGAEKSENPWHIKEYRADEFRELLERHFSDVEIHGVFHARKLAVHQFLIERLGWDRLHKTLRITKPFYGWFTPAIATSDFVLRRAEDGANLDKALDFVAVVRP